MPTRSTLNHTCTFHTSESFVFRSSIAQILHITFATPLSTLIIPTTMLLLVSIVGVKNAEVHSPFLPPHCAHPQPPAHIMTNPEVLDRVKLCHQFSSVKKNTIKESSSP